MHQDDLSQEEKLKMLNWISPTNYPARHSALMKHVPKNIGKLFLAIPEVEQWSCRKGATLLLSGLPKSGKTIIAAAVVDGLIQAKHDRIGVVYFTCNPSQDVSGLLSAILRQILESSGDMRPAHFLYKQHIHPKTRPSLYNISTALSIALRRYLLVFIVIDDLDECQNHVCAQLLSKIRELQADHFINILATIRSTPEIIDSFHGDVHLYVKRYWERCRPFFALYRLPTHIHETPLLQEVVQEMITEAKDQM